MAPVPKKIPALSKTHKDKYGGTGDRSHKEAALAGGSVRTEEGLAA